MRYDPAYASTFFGIPTNTGSSWRRWRRIGELIAWVLAWVVPCLVVPAAQGTPLISEFMAENEGTLADEDGEFSDWIEIWNPDARAVDLTGCFLTDDPARLNRWAFPQLSLASGQFLVVFASGKNRRNRDMRLHTDFRLSAEGEYLALLAPDGRTILSEFAPGFPMQHADVSYGGADPQAQRDLLAAAKVEVKVPAEGGTLEPDWFQAEFMPAEGWKRKTGLALGFDQAAVSPESANLGRLGTALQSSIGFGFGPRLAIDGDPDTFSHTGSNDDASSWSLRLDREYEITRIVLRNRTSCCASRLRDITVSILAPDGATVRWSSGLLNPENILQGPAAIVIDLFELNVGPVPGQLVRVERTPDPDLSGSGGAGNIDEDNVLALGEVEVRGIESIRYLDLIRNDVGAEMRGHSATVAARLSFVVDQPPVHLETLSPRSPVPGLGDISGTETPRVDSFPPSRRASGERGTFPDSGTLRLRVRYDDGFIAWLNGVRVAEANAPPVASPPADATATSARPDAEALSFATFEVPVSRLAQGTNVLAIQGLNVSRDDDDFLLDARLDATGLVRAPVGFLNQATPGAPNSAGAFRGILAPPRFSVPHGFPQGPFRLELTTDDAEAVIRYTLDGSEPTETHGATYESPIPIAGTSGVRARVVRPEHWSSVVLTRSYIFLQNVIHQPSDPPGFPARWAGVEADYEMDPEITDSPEYASRFLDALRVLPTVAITTEVGNLFDGTTGIYANPENRGDAWERPVSLEWLEFDGAADFQVDCGLRIQGGWFRQRGVTGKHSLRLLFRNAYGAGRLRQDLFKEFGATRNFDTLVLRAGANDGYAWDAAIDTEQFLRDEFGRRLALDMGQPSSRGRFVHVYLNGLYWGLYNLCERPDEDFSASYLGGEPAGWDSVNSGEVKSGDLSAWNQLLQGVRSAATATDLLRLQGLDATGKREPGWPVLLDLANYVDYMLLNIWGGNWDWPNKNFWFARSRSADSTGFKFYVWDFENTMGNNRNRSPLDMVAPRAEIESSWVAEAHARLSSLPDYRLAFADHVQRHFFGDGVLTPASLVGRYRQMAAGIEAAMVAEIARWGDDHHEPPQDLDDWKLERDWLLETYLPHRTEVVLEQLRSADLFPATPAPVLEPNGGAVAATTPILLKTAARSVYYTLDGSDPRLPGGLPSPSAHLVEFANAWPVANPIPGWNVAPPLFMAVSGWIRARSWSGSEWSPITEARFTVDTSPPDAANLVISEIAYRPPDAATPSELAVSRDRDDYEFVELLNVGAKAIDLSGVRVSGGVRFEFGVGAAVPAGGRIVLVARRAAFEARYGTSIPVMGEYAGRLANEGDTLRLEDASGNVMQQLTYSPNSPWPVSTVVDGFTLVRIRPGDPQAGENPADWRQGAWPEGSPGGGDATPFSGRPEGDTDGNGRPDLVDHLLGGGAENGQYPGLMITREELATPAGVEVFLRLNYGHNRTAEDARLQIQVADSPAGRWESTDSELTYLGAADLGGGRSLRSYHTAMPSSTRPRFYRLVILR